MTVEEAGDEETDEASLLAGEAAQFNARVNPRTRAAGDKRLRLALDTSRLYFFDRSSGRNLTASSSPRR